MQHSTDFPDALESEIEEKIKAAKAALVEWNNTSLIDRQFLMHDIADHLEQQCESLVEIAIQETKLTKDRLISEMKRTVFQWRAYADYCRSGHWLQASIDAPTLTGRDIRKTMMALGPVVVFGAGNFPFAYSTAGGDVASALAAGCPVIVKAHPAHPKTASLSDEIIENVILRNGFPKGTFQQVHGKSFKVGEYLVKHPEIKAVAFTGSFSGGKQLFDWGQQRPEPIPVFSEMGSSNPIFIFSDFLKNDIEALAEDIFQSITQSAGQFCTKPGLLILQAGQESENFIRLLENKFRHSTPMPMVSEGIFENYHKRKEAVIDSKAINILATATNIPGERETSPLLLRLEASDFLENPDLSDEVFGPLSIIVHCSGESDVLRIAKSMKGQLTMSIFADPTRLKDQKPLLDIMKAKAGRIIFNGVPTGVDVCLSMHHGGPFPATTDSRFSSVGGHGIHRFCRPVSFQNSPQEILPLELRNENVLGIWRTVNGELTNTSI